MKAGMTRPETIIYIAATVDGFIARADGGLDWLEHDAGGEDYGWQAFRQSLDAVVFGRKTYQQVRDFGGPWPYQGLTSVVWSRTLTAAHIPEVLVEQGVEVSSRAPAALLDGLGHRGVKRVWVDGGQTLQAFLAAGLIDSLIVTRLPILIGQGVPLFGALSADARLRHEQTRTWPSGLVQSRYAVLRSDPGAGEVA